MEKCSLLLRLLQTQEPCLVTRHVWEQEGPFLGRFQRDWELPFLMEQYPLTSPRPTLGHILVSEARDPGLTDNSHFLCQTSPNLDVCWSLKPLSLSKNGIRGQEATNRA